VVAAERARAILDQTVHQTVECLVSLAHAGALTGANGFENGSLDNAKQSTVGQVPLPSVREPADNTPQNIAGKTLWTRL
jgi:hypothetical protein